MPAKVAREVFKNVSVCSLNAEALPRVHIGGRDSSLDGAASGQVSPVLRARLRFRYDILHALRCRLRGTLQALRSPTIDTQGGIHFQGQRRSRRCLHLMNFSLKKKKKTIIFVKLPLTSQNLYNFFSRNKQVTYLLFPNFILIIFNCQRLTLERERSTN